MASNNLPSSASTPGLIGRRGGRGNRLPSLRAPRDLTLGGVQKKTFVPNIPVRPKDKKEDSQDGSSAKQSRDGDRQRGKHGRGRGERGRGRGERGRGRGRGEREIIQSHSIFEQGPTDSLKPRGSGWGIEPIERASTSRTTSIKKEKKDPEETKRILDDLMKDDFISDNFSSEDPNLVPIKLPLCDFKIEPKSEEKPDVKADIKIKVEKDEDGGDEQMEPKLQKVDKAAPKFGSPNRVKYAAELFTDSTKSEQGELLFIQLPDTLPGEPPEKEDEKESKHSKPPETSTEELPVHPEQELAKRLGLVSLQQFSEGYVGKVQIHKSGKTRLVLGNVALDMTLGTPSGFLQDVVSIKTEEGNKEGEMAVLGHITNKLVCVPDFEEMMDT